MQMIEKWFDEFEFDRSSIKFLGSPESVNTNQTLKNAQWDFRYENVTARWVSRLLLIKNDLDIKHCLELLNRF